MKIYVFVGFILCLVTIISPAEIFAETALDVYMNDFYSKSNEASQIPVSYTHLTLPTRTRV